MGQRCGDGAGAAKLPSNIQETFRRHIEAAQKKYSTTEKLVNHLRSSYPHYARHNLLPFTKHVDRIIQVSKVRDDAVNESNDNADILILKKRRKIDEEEEKLQLVAGQHVSLRDGAVLRNKGDSSSSLLSASLSDLEDSSNEEMEEAVYGERFDPEFDLMKSMMREALCRRSKKIRGAGDLESNIVDDKGVEEVNLMREKGRLGDTLREINKNARNGGVRLRGQCSRTLGVLME